VGPACQLQQRPPSPLVGRAWRRARREAHGAVLKNRPPRPGPVRQRPPRRVKSTRAEPPPHRSAAAAGHCAPTVVSTPQHQPRRPAGRLGRWQRVGPAARPGSAAPPPPSSSAIAEFLAPRRGERRHAIAFFRRARRPELSAPPPLPLPPSSPSSRAPPPFHRVASRAKMPPSSHASRASRRATGRRPQLFGLHRRTPPSGRATSPRRRAERRCQARTVRCPPSNLAEQVRALLAPIVVVALSSSSMCRRRSASSRCQLRRPELALPRCCAGLAAVRALPGRTDGSAAWRSSAAIAGTPWPSSSHLAKLPPPPTVAAPPRAAFATAPRSRRRAAVPSPPGAIAGRRWRRAERRGRCALPSSPRAHGQRNPVASAARPSAPVRSDLLRTACQRCRPNPRQPFRQQAAARFQTGLPAGFSPPVLFKVKSRFDF
jgi:hypothetical protein